MRSLIHRLRSRLQPGGGEADDESLLVEFLENRTDDAFATIVRRHGPMVMGVCRRVLRNDADADDAFQAVWLVLLRKADAVRPRSQLGNFLYGVAVNVARRGRDAVARRQMPSLTVEVPGRETADTDLREVLDSALSELPDAYRAAVVACDLEGYTRAEAAGRLGWSEGTVASRLARGRALLADRLTRRGAVLPAAGLAAVLEAEVNAAGAVPLASTLLLHPSPVADKLAAEVTRAMFTSKVKGAVMTLVVAVALAGAGIATVWARGGFDPRPAPQGANRESAPRENEPLALNGVAGAAKPVRFVVRNPARDIAVVTDRNEAITEFFRRQPVMVARVKPELLRRVLEGTSGDRFEFVDSASFNADDPRVAAYGASVKLAPAPVGDGALRDLLSGAAVDQPLIFVRDPADKNLWHAAGLTRRSSLGFFASKERVPPDDFVPADLIQVGGRK